MSLQPRMAAALGRLRAAAGVAAPAEIEVDQLRDVERGVGIRFNDDMLAVFCAHVPALAEAHAMTLGRVIPHTGALREARVRGDLIGVGKAGARVYLCVEMGVASDDTVLLEHDIDEARGAEIRTPLIDWLEALCERTGCAELDPAPFEPRVIHSMPESYVGRRVRHKVFGDGKVLTEIGDGANKKVKAEFPGHGLKLLAARFVEFLE